MQEILTIISSTGNLVIITNKDTITKTITGSGVLKATMKGLTANLETNIEILKWITGNLMIVIGNLMIVIGNLMIVTEILMKSTGNLIMVIGNQMMIIGNQMKSTGNQTTRTESQEVKNGRRYHGKSMGHSPTLAGLIIMKYFKLEPTFRV